MKKKINLSLIFCYLLIGKISFSQTLFIGWGPVREYTSQQNRMINSKDYFFSSHTQKLLGFEYPKEKWSLLLSIATYDFSTMMRLSDSWFQGFDAKITRGDIGLTYNLLKTKNRLFIKPFVVLGLQYTKKQGGYWGEPSPVMGPDYFETEAPISVGRNNFQLVPSLGLRVGVKFLKRLEFGASVQGVYGTKAFNRLYFRYYYKDDPGTNRIAIFEGKGTGIVTGLFLGVNRHTARNSDCEQKAGQGLLRQEGSLY